jgi:hypothetical protein
MKTHFNILGMIALTVMLALLHIDRSFAALTLVENNNSVPVLSLEEDNSTTAIPSLPVTPPAPSVFRDVPALSGRYSLGDMTLLPYIGAGYGAGYTSELDRTFAPPPPPQQNLNVGGQHGQSVVPNEFQMGIRIPF